MIPANVKIIIPARLGSKGLPFKNRKLFKYTADIIPDNFKNNTYLTTDDPELKLMASSYNFNIINRPLCLSQDTTSTRDTVIHALDNIDHTISTVIIVLYLTYPERTWKEVEDAYLFFDKYYTSWTSNSMLCKKKAQISPYLYLKETGPKGIFGKQLESHDFYRRQDYPVCFEISHYICMFISGAINKLNNNMYREDTVFYPIADPIDVDTLTDFEKYSMK